MMAAIADRRYAELQLEAAMAARIRLLRRAERQFGKAKAKKFIGRMDRTIARANRK